jgi:hypothetical protein
LQAGPTSNETFAGAGMGFLNSQAFSNLANSFFSPSDPTQQVKGSKMSQSNQDLLNPPSSMSQSAYNQPRNGFATT